MIKFQVILMRTKICILQWPDQNADFATFSENLVCVVLTFGSKVTVMKKSLAVCTSIDSWTNFSQKNHCTRSEVSAKMKSLKNANNLQKMAKIGTLGLKGIRGTTIKHLMSDARTR